MRPSILITKSDRLLLRSGGIFALVLAGFFSSPSVYAAEKNDEKSREDVTLKRILRVGTPDDGLKLDELQIRDEEGRARAREQVRLLADYKNSEYVARVIRHRPVTLADILQFNYSGLQITDPADWIRIIKKERGGTGDLEEDVRLRMWIRYERERYFIGLFKKYRAPFVDEGFSLWLETVESNMWAAGTFDGIVDYFKKASESEREKGLNRIVEKVFERVDARKTVLPHAMRLFYEVGGGIGGNALLRLIYDDKYSEQADSISVITTLQAERFIGLDLNDLMQAIEKLSSNNLLAIGERSPLYRMLRIALKQKKSWSASQLIRLSAHAATLESRNDAQGIWEFAEGRLLELSPKSKLAALNPQELEELAKLSVGRKGEALERIRQFQKSALKLHIETLAPLPAEAQEVERKNLGERFEFDPRLRDLIDRFVGLEVAGGARLSPVYAPARKLSADMGVAAGRVEYADLSVRQDSAFMRSQIEWARAAGHEVLFVGPHHPWLADGLMEVEGREMTVRWSETATDMGGSWILSADFKAYAVAKVLRAVGHLSLVPTLTEIHLSDTRESTEILLELDERLRMERRFGTGKESLAMEMAAELDAVVDMWANEEALRWKEDGRLAREADMGAETTRERLTDRLKLALKESEVLTDRFEKFTEEANTRRITRSLRIGTIAKGVSEDIRVIREIFRDWVEESLNDLEDRDSLRDMYELLRGARESRSVVTVAAAEALIKQLKGTTSSKLKLGAAEIDARRVELVRMLGFLASDGMKYQTIGYTIAAMRKIKNALYSLAIKMPKQANLKTQREAVRALLPILERGHLSHEAVRTIYRKAKAYWQPRKAIEKERPRFFEAIRDLRVLSVRVHRSMKGDPFLAEIRSHANPRFNKGRKKGRVPRGAARRNPRGGSSSKGREKPTRK